MSPTFRSKSRRKRPKCEMTYKNKSLTCEIIFYFHIWTGIRFSSSSVLCYKHKHIELLQFYTFYANYILKSQFREVLYDEIKQVERYHIGTKKFIYVPSGKIKYQVLMSPFHLRI